MKGAVDLVALVRSRGLELKRHGSKDWIGRCPFHADQETPNFIVSPDKGLFHCMGCGKAGNAIQFVQFHDGVSFRHAFELLAEGHREQGPAAFMVAPREGPVKESTVPKLPSPLEPSADDVELMEQALAYYRERLQQTPAALEYLERRGLAAAVEAFGLGFADRTLGLRLPQKNRQDGEALRARLQGIGLIRASGHEHFNGCMVFPIRNDKGQVTEIYGRKINDNLRPGTAYHLYLPGPHVGIFNRECLSSPEIILCEAVIDALTFWVNGFQNVTCIYGTEGFTEELLEAFRQHRTRRVYLAYDRDEAGDRAALRDAERLQRFGIECFRVKFPHGLDANEYARKVTPPEKSLALLVNSADWLGAGARPQGDTAAGADAGQGGRPQGPPKHVAMVVDELTGEPLPIVDHESLTSGVGWAPAGFVPAPYEEVQEQGGRAPAPSSLAAAAVSSQKPTAKEGAGARPPDVPGVVVNEGADGVTLRIGDREWRARGVENNTSFDLLKVNLRLLHNERMHLDTLDLYQARQRQAFVRQAAEETNLEPELVQRDLGRVLLELEGVRDRRLLGVMQPTEPVPSMTDGERAEALALLKDPRLLDRILADFDACGVVGESTNKLTGYLAAVSRLLDRPLGVIVQSTSAAGKSTLMEAILAFVPGEHRVKYSAMTGQSLYYLGDADLRHKVLAIVEEEGAEKASYALKLLQSEGELTIASTGKDPQTGKMVTQEYHVEGPVMIFLTTTAVDVDEELLNRCLVLTVDEGREQTEAIHRLQREQETFDGLRRKLERERVLAVHRNAQRLLQPLHVVNAYAPQLTFLSDRTRTRRDHMKYLTLIRTIALLHQHKREAKPLPNAPDGAGRYIEVTFDDIEAANRLAHEVLGRSLDELPPQTRRLLGLLDQMARRQCEERKLDRTRWRFTRREVREATGWGNTQLKVHLARLEDLEYLAAHRHPRHAQGHLYELLYDGQGQDGGRFLPRLLDVGQLRHGYDANRSGPNVDRPGAGRPLVGGVPGAGRAGGSAASPNGHGALLAGDSFTTSTARPADIAACVAS